MRLSAAGVYERYGGYVVRCGAKKLAGRLLFLEDRGLAHLLVADKQAAKKAWRLQRGLPANRSAPGEPTFITVGDCAILPDAKFTSLLPDGAAADFPAFMARLQELPVWQQLCAEAEVEAERLTAQLPPELRPGAASAAAADEVGEDGSEGLEESEP